MHSWLSQKIKFPGIFRLWVALWWFIRYHVCYSGCIYTPKTIRSSNGVEDLAWSNFRVNHVIISRGKTAGKNSIAWTEGKFLFLRPIIHVAEVYYSNNFQYPLQQTFTAKKPALEEVAQASKRTAKVTCFFVHAVQIITLIWISVPWSRVPRWVFSSFTCMRPLQVSISFALFFGMSIDSFSQY